MLADDDPVLAEGSGDPVLNGVLVDGSEVDVGSSNPLLRMVEGSRWSLTKTCLP